MTIQVYGIPTCGTCKKALKWLQENQLEFEFINTKEEPPAFNKFLLGLIRLALSPCGTHRVGPIGL